MAHRRLLRAGLVAAGAFALLAPDLALAQGELEEVIVTARRRSESAQSVPIAITAIGSEEIAKKNIVSGEDLQHAVPGLTLTTGTGRDAASVILRGQGATYTGYNNQPGVVAYFGEVPTPSGGITVGQYLDLETISVLKGPQGTLFGRNTTGGAVLLEPKRPGNEFGGYVQGIVGDYNRHDAEGAVNLPIVKDKLLLRLTGSIGHRDGYTKEINTGRDYDNRDYWSFRGSMLWHVNDKIDNLLIGSSSNSSSNGLGTQLALVNPTGTPNILATFGAYPGFPSLVTLQQQQTALGPRRVSHDETGESTELRLSGVQDKLTVELNDNLTLVNLASYYRYRQRWNGAIDEDGSPLPLYLISNTYAGDWSFPTSPNGTKGPPQQLSKQGWFSAQNIYTEELQLQGKARNNKLTYAIGGYYEKSEPEGYVAQAATPFAFAGTKQAGTISFSTNETNSKAIFAQATYDLGDLFQPLDGLRVTAGYRHTWDEVKNFFTSYDLGLATALSFFGAPTPKVGDCHYGDGPGNYNCGTNGRVTFDADTWTLGLDYTIKPGQLVYFTHRRGYKAGGFNNSAPANLRGFSPETLTDYEVGFKGDWNAGTWKVRTNIDAYYSRYKNIQQVQAFLMNINGTSTIAAAVLNGSTAQIYGVDVEATVIPSKWIEFTGFYSHTDAHYDHYYDTRLPFPDTAFCPGGSASAPVVCPTGFNGELPGVPEHKASASLKLIAPVPDTWGNLSLTTTYTYQSHFFQSNPAQNPGYPIRPYSLVNMNLDWDHIADSPVSASLFVTNLTDKVYQTGEFDAYRAIGFIAYQYGEPRMFGARIRYDFGG